MFWRRSDMISRWKRGMKLTGFEGSHTVTKGDVSFARLIIESSYILDNWNDPHVYMQMKALTGR